jgi:hypothetical protein
VKRYVRWLLGGWRAVYDACRDDTYPVAGCGQWRLQAACNATAWAWDQWWRWDRHTIQLSSKGRRHG